MVIKVGINGFGRIGRIIFRTCCQTPEIKVAAINDPAIEVEYICYLMKFDSTHGKHNGSISYEGNEIKIDGHSIKIFHHKAPSDIQWQDAGVQYVVEASGMFTNLEKASGHLASDGVRRVLVTAPSADVPMIILGVNEDKLNADLKVISCASSTLYCLAPIVKLLQDTFGVSEGFVTSIHAMTPSLKPLDGLCIRGKHWRDHRSIHQNIIPAATGACKALGRIVPAVRDKLTGIAFRVPVVNVSVLDLSIRLNKSTSIKEITRCIEELKDSPLHSIMQVSKEQAVSSDFAGDKHSCTLDVDSSLELRPNFFKLICWYENEYSYACRVVDTILHSERQQLIVQPVTKIPCLRPRSWKTQREGQQTDDFRKHVGIECVSFPILLPNPCDTRVARLSSRPLLRRSTIAYSPEASQLRKQPTRQHLTSFDTLSKCCSVQNKMYFHEKSIALQKKYQQERGQTQERLEAVKKELNKIANITEDLIKKSNSIKFEPISAAITSSKEIIEKAKSHAHSPIDADNKKIISETFEKHNEEKHNSPTIEICGDFKTFQLYTSSKGLKDSGIMLNDNSSNSFRQQEVSNSSQTKSVESNILRKIVKNCSSKNISCEIKNTDQIYRNISWNKNKQSVLHEDVITKEIKTESNFKNSKFFECISIDASANIDEKLNVDEVIHIINETPECKNSCTETITQENKINVNDSQKIDENDTLKVVQIKEHEKDQTANLMDRVLLPNIELIDEKLKQRNIVVVENENNNAVDVFREDAFKQMHKDFQRCTDDPRLSDETSRCVSPVNTVTTISNVETYRSKQDIYDKLDSASVSGSDISFQMREKKSQIINITELAYSMEDLARLDKICRIIEISDELSDKLFAPLDCVKGGQIDKKKWSFKNLCEKIKLDEFCNNVFGKSAS